MLRLGGAGSPGDVTDTTTVPAAPFALGRMTAITRPWYAGRIDALLFTWEDGSPLCVPSMRAGPVMEKETTLDALGTTAPELSMTSTCRSTCGGW